MFGLGSARSRAILAGTVGLLLLAGVAATGAADVTLWLLIGVSAAAFLAVTATVAGLIVWTVQPLAALRASARAIAAGDTEARAKVSGPEEVASLASDFNAMTDALSAKTEEYIATTNLTGDIIVKVGRDGRVTFLNDAACQFYGKPREELLGVQFADYVHAEDLPSVVQVIREAAARKEPGRRVVNRQVTPIGTRVVEWNGYALFDDGQNVGLQLTGRDITERKRAEEALRQSEARYRLLAENATDVIWILDLNLRFTYVSPSVTRLRGYTVQEAMGQTLKEMLTPASLKVAKKAIAAEQAIEQMEEKDLSRSRTVEVEQTCKDGSTVWVEGKFAILRDPDGQAIGTLGIARDISERKRAEEALRESEEKYRRVVQDSLDGIVITQGLEMRLVNPALLKMFGCEREEEMMGRPFIEFISPEYRELLVERGYAREKGEAEPERYEYKALRKDGSEFHAEISVTRIVYQGKAARQGIVRDVSERKRAEDALRQSEERLRILFEFAPDAIYLHDLEGNFVDGNRAAEELTGYKREELIGKNLLESNLFPPEQLPRAAATVAKLVQGVPAGTDEYTLIRKDGKHVAVETRGFPVKIGAQTLVLGIGRDITERKRAEEALARVREEVESRVERRMQEVNGYGLTFRELAVLHLVAAGKADKEIATVLGISPLTAHKHLGNILEKMGAASRTEAGVRALREGLLD